MHIWEFKYGGVCVDVVVNKQNPNALVSMSALY